MRCNSCNKFVGYNDPEVEEAQQAEVEGVEENGTIVFTVTGSINVRLTCVECSDTLKESEVEYERTTEPVKVPEGFKYVEGSASWSDNGPSEATKTEGKGRGTKTFYGFDLEGTISYELEAVEGAESAERKEETLDLSIDEYVQASHMDEVQ